MGILDSLFGKKVTVHSTDAQGKTAESKVPLKQLQEWEASGKISMIEAVQVHVLDPKGSYSAHWQIGKQVSAETVAKQRDPVTGDLYALTAYEAGKPRTVVLPKAHWLKAKAAMAE